jgi:hypothetical protein
MFRVNPHDARPRGGKFDPGGDKEPRLEHAVAVGDERLHDEGPGLGLQRGTDVGKRALEPAVRIALDGEGDSLALLDRGHCRLGNGELDAQRINPDQGQQPFPLLGVAPDVHVLLGHQTAKGRTDHGVLQRLPCHGHAGSLRLEQLEQVPRLVQGRLVLCFCAEVVGALEVVLRARHRPLVNQLGKSLVIRLGSIQGCPSLHPLRGGQRIEGLVGL